MATPITYIGDKYAKGKQDKPTVSSGQPRLVSQSEFKAIQPLQTATKVTIRNMFWMNTPIEAGVVFLTSQGRRIVLEANPHRVVYVLLSPVSKTNTNNSIYMQPTKGFVADVVYFPLEEAGRNLQTVKKLAEYEIQILIGILSVTSWSAFAAVMSMDVLEFGLKNKDNFSKWNRILKATLQTRRDFIKYAPILYNKLLYSTLLIAWEGTKYAGSQSGEISDALAEESIKDPKVAGRGVGIIIGKIGLNAMNGRIGVLSVVWTLLVTTATKAMAAIPGALQASTEAFKEKQIKDKVEVAQQLLNIVKKANIELSKSEAEAIVGEVYKHPRELASSLSQLAKAFKND